MNTKKNLNQSANGRPIIRCKHCGNQKEIHAKGSCTPCYKKYEWKPKMITCAACGRSRKHKAFGLCDGCHIRLHHYDRVKAFNARKYHNISLEKLREYTKTCGSCGFSKMVTLHHLDGDTKNNDHDNLVGLCPNCHRMIHTHAYHDEVKRNLMKKGYKVQGIHPTNFKRM